MGAARFVGRVGGLAVALGVGAAMFSGYGVAWADSASTGSSGASSSSDSGGSTAAGTSGSASKRSSTGTAGSARAASATSSAVVSTGGAQTSSRVRSRSHARVAGLRAKPSSSVAGTSTSSADVTGTPASSTAAGGTSQTSATVTETDAVAPSVTKVADNPLANAVHALQAVAPKAPVELPTPAAVSGVLTSVVHGIMDPFAGNNPTVPVDSPLALALVEFTRRESASALATATPAALTSNALVSNNPISINPMLDIVDGIINGTTNAMDSTGTPLTYTLIDGPSAGGKVTFSATGDSNYTLGNFSYLPDKSVLASGDEQFKILVAQNTQFDQFLASIPIVGLFVPQTLVVLHQVPIVNDLLAPIIGYSQVATFDSSSVLPATDPVAYTYKMPSFDGTLISVNWFPATGLGSGDTATTVLDGPGLASAGQTDPYTLYGITGLTPGVQELRANGYNVVTWDPRGEFASGGVLQLDNPFYEGRDVSSIVSWVAGLDNSVLDSAGDPRAGMVGGSYGGGIQLTSAATDPRIDAIVPGISWNSLNNSLYPDKAFKTSYASLLLLSLVLSNARINNQIYLGIATGDLVGWLSQTSQAVLSSSGPTSLLNQLQAPSLLIQGTVDVLFTLQQAIDNAETITANPYDTPVNMIWFCGGHGVCLTNDGTVNPNLDSTFDWLDYYVKQGNTGTLPGLPTFQYTDQKGNWYESDYLPSDPTFYGTPDDAVTDASGGVLAIAPILGGSGPAPQASIPYSLGLASKANNAINVDVPTQTGQYVGAPTLSFNYSGLGTNRYVYAQLVDNDTGLVVGNLVTPVPVTMDGRTHTATINMENLVYTVDDPNTDNLTLQITSSATAYENFTAFGVINISDINLTLPTPATITPQP